MHADAAAARPAALVALAGIALLGNGLKAVVSSTVLVGEARFAAFLAIPVEHVATLLEAIFAGMVIAVAASPLLLRRFRARTVAAVAGTVAAAAFAAFALVDHVAPALPVRVVAVFAAFTIGSGAVACLAPAAQALVLLWPTAAGRASLTTLWTGAAPAGFMAAPQLVKLALPVAGLAVYFAAFATLPLAMAALALVLGLARAAPPPGGDAAGAPPARVLLAFVAVVVAFEAWSTLGSLTRYTAPATLVALAALACVGAWFTRALRHVPPSGGEAASAYRMLFALFMVEIATTGFFEAAFLTERLADEAFVADRSTANAAAQIAGTLVAGYAARRWPGACRALLLVFAVVAAAGLAAYVPYPWIADRAYFLWTATVTGFGTAGLTVVVCLAVLPAGRRAALVAALPSIAIIVGTEVGLETLQLAFAAVTALGVTVPVAYGTLFAAQAAIGLAVPWLLAAAARQGLPADGEAAAPAAGARATPAR